MNGKELRRRVLFALPALLLALSLFGALAAEIPARAAIKGGVSVSANAKAAVDWSNLAEGFVSVKYTGGRDVRIKAQVIKTGGTTYTYNLNSEGEYETFPLVEGDGAYKIRVMENTTGTKYAQAFAVTLTLKLRSEFSPFLYANQYVNYAADSKTALKAAELCKEKKTELEKVAAVYDFVVNGFTYDKEKAKTVQSGYLPDVDAVLEAKKGICFDYAAVMAAMLRSQGVPAKLVVGYAGTVYHAWISVYISGTGWVEKLVYFDGESWQRMDPTFASSGKNDPSVLKYIGDGANYTQKYAY